MHGVRTEINNELTRSGASAIASVTASNKRRRGLPVETGATLNQVVRREFDRFGDNKQPKSGDEEQEGDDASREHGDFGQRKMGRRRKVGEGREDETALRENAVELCAFMVFDASLVIYPGHRGRQSKVRTPGCH